MKQLFVVALLVSLCSATSPPFPYVFPVDCNATQIQTDVAISLINEERDEGFLLRPLRVVSVFQQMSEKLPGASIYYLDLDVVESGCSVLSGKSWKDCSQESSLHETVFGHCKAIIFISRPWRILKLLNYNCTLGTVPSRSIAMMCPDCPVLVRNISPEIKAKADLLTKQFNRESNQTHHFKMNNIEKVRTQYVFGQSYFFYFTIKETDCLKTQADVNLDDCNSLKDQEAHVGFCSGSTYSETAFKQGSDVSCEIYNPREDKDDHGHKHGHCNHGPDSSKTEQGQENSNPNADDDDVKQEGTGDAEQGRPHRGRKHHRCHHDHHRHHPSHHHPHHCHHHHHHDHHNGNHSHDPSHRHHKQHHHHHHHHNHTSSDDGSSSEEHSDNKPFEKRSKGSVQLYHLSTDQDSVPVPSIFRLPPPPERPGKSGKFGRHGKHDIIEFPSEHSKLNTCPGEPLVVLPDIIKNIIFT